MIFLAGDEIECSRVDANSDDWEGKLLRTGEVGVFSKLLTKGWEVVVDGVAKNNASLARISSVSRKSSLVIVQRPRSQSISYQRQPNTLPNPLEPLLNSLVEKMTKVGEAKDEDEDEEEDEEELLFLPNPNLSPRFSGTLIILNKF